MYRLLAVLLAFSASQLGGCAAATHFGYIGAQGVYALGKSATSASAQESSANQDREPNTWEMRDKQIECAGRGGLKVVYVKGLGLQCINGE